MKLCQKCGQSVAEDVGTCPSCGGEVGDGIKTIDEYRIEEVLHEGHDSILCRAVKEGDDKPVMIRLFTPQSALNEEVADRLKKELEQLKKLPSEHFVSHQEIRRSSEGLWYRVSEWVDAESWGDLVRSGHLEDYRVAFDLFSRIASVLAILHETGHIIPHLILNDIMLIKEEEGKYNVKIDYKLSRFLDPKLDRPGPMLKRLLTCHPDIINQRPLDFRSDVWSLGKIFIELLTADYETCDFTAKIDELSLPPEAEALFRTMLAEDPALRPGSMQEVADALNQIPPEEIEEAKTRAMELVATSAKTVRRIKKRQTLLAVVIALLILAGGVAWYKMGVKKKDSVAVLENYANQYAPAVAFVVVEYWLKEGETTIYRNRAEGTAFLADRDGYLLTNRHVACPWLEDNTLLEAIYFFRQSGRSARFGYKMLLWFEGEKAFKRSADLIGSQELGDLFFLGSAFRSDGIPRLTIVGVAKPPVQTRQLVTSPLRDDFAVLKIDRVPEGLSPLPLDLKLDPRAIPKLSRVMTLGFPLGSRYQESTVNVSVTGGHVRRTFEDLLQVDMAFYGGDSGGPIIDTRGKVIGIASGVATTLAPGVMPITTPLWNLAMVQPITKAAAFLQEVKTGQVKWNGIFDLSLEGKLREIIQAAFQGRWAEAMALADKELRSSSHPSLVMAAGMMHFCAGDDQGASRLFAQSLSMDPRNSLARLMLYIISRQVRAPSGDTHRDALLALDWRSEAEFLGYMCRVLEGMVDEEIALEGWDTAAERSWLHYAVGLIKHEQGQWAESERLLKEAVLSSNAEAWEFFLSRAKLEEVQKRRLDALQGNGQWAEYQASIDAFNQTVQKDQMAKKSRQSELAALRAELQNPLTSMKGQREALERIYEEDPDNGDALVGLAFFSGVEEAWDKALTYTRRFLKRTGRQNASRMRMGLLEAQILHYTGKREEALVGLEAYARVTRDSWFRSVSECLLGKRSVESLKKEAGKHPENLLTLYTALGLWAEGSDEREMAVEYYEEALESLLDTWHEFAFARERIKRLRQGTG
jgi:S1-C subfamily serine protease/signal transduction histidine kinase